MSYWTDETRELAVAAYTEAEPTQENSMEIVREIADDTGQSPNGVRAILSKAGVYIKKEATASKAKEGEGTKRVSKQDSQDALVKAIQKAEQAVDIEIINKLTGKAAVYLTEVIAGISG